MRVALAFALTLAFLPTAPACNDCPAGGSCTYATLFLLVHDQAAGDRLPEAIVSQAGSPLSGQLTAVSCADNQCTHAVSPGPGRVTISLDGYQDAVIDYAQPRDACGYAARQFFDVGLRTTTATTPSVVTGPQDRGSGCNSL